MRMHRKPGSDHSVPKRMLLLLMSGLSALRGQSGLTSVCPVNAFRLLGVLLFLLIGLRLYPHAPLSTRVPLSTAIYSSDGELLRVTLSSDDQFRLWTPLSQMSPQLTEAFLVKEDRWFYLHPGLNLPAITRAAFRTGRGERRQVAPRSPCSWRA